MKYGVIDPARMICDVVDVPKDVEPRTAAGLGDVDHGIVWRDKQRGLGIMVAEFGLFEPPEQQRYFSLLAKLYAGAAVVYAFDDEGRTVDIRPEDIPPVLFFRDASEIERAIGHGDVERPRMHVNDIPIWSWPGPNPWGKA